MTAFVIDASTVLSWCFEDEAGPETDALIGKVAADGAAVPGLWLLEVAKGLAAGERRGRIKPAESATFIRMIEDLPITLDRAAEARAFHEMIVLARDTKLSVYDAACLELAMRLGLPLVTRDNGLKKAAQR